MNEAAPHPTNQKELLWKRKNARGVVVFCHLANLIKIAKNKDGLQAYCRECQHEAYQASHLLKEKLLSNNSLSGYTPRELLAELKKRGYKWDKMYYTQEIKYENI